MADLEVNPDGIYSEIGEFFGASKKKMLEFARQFGGMVVYFPSFGVATKQSRDRKIGQDFNGTNYNELANKYGLSVQRIRDIVGKKKKAVPEQRA